MSGVVVHSQAREIIYKLYEFMKREKESNDFIIPVDRVYERLTEATGISIRTIKRITQEGKSKPEGSKFGSPRKTINKPAPRSTIDKFDEEIVRRIIYNFVYIQKQKPTMQNVFAAVQEEGIHLRGKLSSFRLIVKKMGFKWQKTKDNRKALVETSAIRAKRTTFLRNMKKYREEGRNIVYSDESYLHSSHTSSHGWYDSSDKGVKAPVSKGQRLIMLHCGGAKGFVPNALLMFKSGLKSGDYHDDMNSKNYIKWLTERLIPNLESNSVLVVDNASYHNISTEPSPTCAWKKCEMQKWLNERGILFEQSETKPELYEKIKLHRPLHKNYLIDKLMAEHGHSVIRLPPYHPEVNPIEKIWAQVKNYVGSNNVTFKFEDVWKLAENKFKLIGRDEWEAVCKHTEKIEKEYLEKEGFIDEVEELIFTVNTGESDDEINYSSSEKDSDSE